MLFLIWFVVMISALVLYFHRTYSVFSRRGVRTLTPVPLFGTTAKIVFRIDHFTEHILNMYNKFPEDRFIGTYEFMKPVVLIRDLELVKNITVKDCEHFLDHRSVFDDKIDPLFGRNLIAMKGQEWKDMRSTLSPAFTSSKMRLMLPLMVEVGDQMIKALKKKIEDSGVGQLELDAKDLTSRFANDVIASCAFGLKVNSLTEENNDFYKMGKAASTFNFRQVLKLFGFAAFPILMKLFKVTLFSKDIQGFFRELVMSTMQDREVRHIIRPDMIYLLMEAKKGKLSHDDKSEKDVDAGFATVEESVVGKKNINRVWTDDDLIAQAVLFLLAGFETVSSTMSFLLHELAVNPDVQERLVQEIYDNELKNGGKFDYNTIQNMVYMDMVVSEVLRLWPPGPILDRVCIKDYNMGKPNNEAKEDYILRKGDGISIPLWAFHHNPEYFPNPERFDPERFSDENKRSIKPFAYMPFGLGPRNCIGSRFALCEVKIMVYQLLQHLEISPCKKTCIPSKLSKDSINLLIEGGHWISLKIRN